MINISESLRNKMDAVVSNYVDKLTGDLAEISSDEVHKLADDHFVRCIACSLTTETIYLDERTQAHIARMMVKAHPYMKIFIDCS